MNVAVCDRIRTILCTPGQSYFSAAARIGSTSSHVVRSGTGRPHIIRRSGSKVDDSSDSAMVSVVVLLRFEGAGWGSLNIVRNQPDVIFRVTDGTLEKDTLSHFA